jgi:hypothetical protein
MPPASLGQDASLSFVVKGSGQKTKDKDSTVGAAFSRDLAILTTSTVRTTLTVSMIHRSPFTI